MADAYRTRLPLSRLEDRVGDVDRPEAVDAFLDEALGAELIVWPDSGAWEFCFRVPDPASPPDRLAGMLEDRFQPSVDGLEAVRVLVEGADPAPLDEWLGFNWSAVKSHLSLSTPVGRSLLSYARPGWDGDELVVEVPDEEWVKLARDRDLPGYLRDWLQLHRGEAPRIRFGVGDFGEDIEEDARAIARRSERERQQRQRRRDTRQRQREESVLLGERIDGEAVPLEDLDANGTSSSSVIVQGELVQCDFHRTAQDKKNLVRGIVSDRTDSVFFKVFTEEDGSELLDREGDWLRLRGRLQQDRYGGRDDEVVIPDDINRIEPVIREDSAPRKRVELHCHSHMSAMDALPDVKDIVRRAAYWDHPAVAITDHGVAHSFPEAAEAAEDAGVKVIFGVEGYLVRDPRPLVFNRGGAEENGRLDRGVVVLDARFEESAGRSTLRKLVAVRLEDDQVLDRLTMVPDEGPGDSLPDELLEWLRTHPVVTLHADRLRGELRERMGGRPGPLVHLERLVDQVLNRSGSDEEELRKLRDACEEAEDIDARLESMRSLLQACRDRMDGPMTISAVQDLRPERNLTDRSYHIILLAKNRTGLLNLYRLVSESHIENFYQNPRLFRSQIDDHRAGLLVGSACEAGEIFQSVVRGQPREDIKERMRFYDLIEVQPVENNRFMIEEREGPYADIESREDLEELTRSIYEMARELDKPVVGTGDVHFMDPEDDVFREILQNFQGFDDPRSQAPLYYRTTDEMIDRFSFLGDEEALRVSVENPQWVADQCEEVKPIPDGFHPPRVEGAEEEFTQTVRREARRLYGEEPPPVVAERLAEETEAIVEHDFSNLYTVAARLVEKSREDGYLVGSRGSVGSSFTAYLMGITEVNPLPAHYRCENCRFAAFPEDADGDVGVDLPERSCPECGEPLKRSGYNIPFEVFCGFEGEKTPDIDLNFSGEYQGEMFRYVEEMFGEENVFRAGTIDTIADRTAAVSVDEYLEEYNLYRGSAEKERYMKGITGVKQNTSQHPGGMIIVPEDRSVYEFTPINYPANDTDADFQTTHFDYHAMEDQLVKLDVLGHDDPTQLAHLEELTGIDPTAVPLDDEETTRLFSDVSVLGIDGDELGVDTGVLGVPEFGTPFVRQMVEETRPATFADLIRISGLSHGDGVWQGNARELIGAGTVDLEGVISCRDDIMNRLIEHGMPEHMAFEIMEAVRRGQGLTDDQARKMKAQGVPEWYVKSCRRIGYLFPKAHATAYVIMAFRIAYFKVHHPVAFYASYLTLKSHLVDAAYLDSPESIERRLEDLRRMLNRNDGTQRDRQEHTVLEVLKEAYLRGVRLRPPRIDASHPNRFIVEDEDVLRAPYVTIEGLGSKLAEDLGREYGNRPFSSVEDATNRTSLNKRVVEHAGEVDFFADLPDEENYALFD